MQSSTLKTTHLTQEEASHKRIATIITVVLLIANTLAFLYGASQSIDIFRQGRFPASVSSVLVAVLINAITLWIIRSGRVTLGVSLLIGTTLILFTGVNLFVFHSGGLAFGIGATLLTLMIAGQTLPSRAATIAIAISVVVGFLNLALDSYVDIPLTRTEAPTTVTLALLAGLTIIYGFFLLRQFNQYTVGGKLIFLFVALSVAAVATLGVVINFTTTFLLTRLTNERLLANAAQLGNELDAYINSAVVNVQVESQLPLFREFLLTPPEQRTAAQKTTLNSTLTILNRKDLNNISSYSLIDKDGLVLGDSFSADIGTNKANRDYFLIPKQTLSMYISPVRISPSSDDLSFYISSPIRNTNGDFLGVLRVRYDGQILQSITYRYLNAAGEGSFGLLVDEDLVYLADGISQNGTLLSAVISPLDKGQAARFASEARIPPNPDTQRFLGNTQLQQGLRIIGNNTFIAPLEQGNKVPFLLATYQMKRAPWKVAFAQPQSIAFDPLKDQSNGIALVAFMIATAVALIAVFVTRIFTTPIISLSNVATQITAGDFSARASVTSTDEIGTLANNFNIMTERLRESVFGLEERVTERTRDLEVANEIGQRVSLTRDLEQLLSESVELIRDRFNLYYVQIYLLDVNTQVLILRAGTGETGKELLRRSHRLTVGTGLNGAAAANRATVIVADTSASPIFSPNPLLPNTRSEMSTPMLIGDRLLGVLDLQSDRPNTLSEDNLSIFITVASQLAIGIENALLLAETEAARRELEAQARRLTREGWQGFLNGIDHAEQIGFIHEENKTLPIAESTDIKLENTLSTPIMVTGETIGIIEIEGDEQRQWTERESGLIQAVAAQVARQVENLRLLEQADQARAEAEFTKRRLTRGGWSKFLQDAPTESGYVYDLNQVNPLQNAKDDSSDKVDVLAYPLKVGYETIGEIAMSEVNNENASELLSTIADALSLHIENLRLAEQTQSALSETATLYDFTAHLNAAPDLNEILKTIAGLQKAARLTLMTIELNPQGQPDMVNIAGTWPQGMSGATPIGTRLRLSQFPASQHWVEQPDEPLFYNDMTTDTTLDEFTRQFNLKLGIRGAVYLALRLGETWVGLLGISWSTPQQFGRSDKLLYQAVASQAAVVINNRILFDQTQKRAERETIINTISQRIQSTTSIEGALEAATREIGQLLKAKRAVVEISNPKQNGH